MEALQEKHLQGIKDAALEIIDHKYRKGQAEHGGELWKHPHLLDEAINEAADQLVYLLTLKDQIKHKILDESELL